MQISKNTSFIVFLFGLLVFVLLRAQYNHLGFLWDEMWSYVPAVRTMHQNGISMLPSAMNPEISRGHPLFFYALSASFLKIFGTSNEAMHALPLLVSCVCAYMTYRIGTEFFSPEVGLISSFLLLLQSIFFVQAAMVLPEIMVSTLVLLAFYAFFKEKIAWYWLFASLLVLTKESGIVLPAALATCYFFKNFNLKSIAFWKKIAWIIAPLSVFVFFLLVQKMTFGWFFFPEHVGLMHFNSNYILHTLEACFNCVFLLQNRRNIFIFGSIIILILYFFNKKNRDIAPKNLGLIAYFVTFIGFYFIFCCVNFFTTRYVLCAIPLALLALVASVFEFLPEKKYLFAYVFFTFCGAMSLHFTLNGHGAGDVELGAFDLIEVQQQAVSTIEKYVPKGQAVITHHGFLKKFALKNPYCGFLKVPYQKIDSTFTPNGIGYFFSVEPDTLYEKMKVEGKIEVLHRFEKGKSVTEVYKVELGN